MVFFMRLWHVPEILLLTHIVLAKHGAVLQASLLTQKLKANFFWETFDPLFLISLILECSCPIANLNFDSKAS